MKIEVSINGPKPYIGTIVGTHAKYGFEVKFLPLRRISGKYHKAEITEPGQYKLLPGSVVENSRIDTGYIVVAEDGKITEIKKEEVAL